MEIMKNEYHDTPIALFIYNRPLHLRRSIESLMRCEGLGKSPIYVFADGASRCEHMPSVKAARSVALEMLGNRATFHLSECNRGLARSIVEGVEKLTELHGAAIVVEDDLVLEPGFIAFMKAALARYADDENVYQISGYAFPCPTLSASTTAVLLPLTSTWGWATWRRAWRTFDPNSTGSTDLLKDRATRKRFNFGGVYDYAAMLERQMEGDLDSWGIRWYWTVFRRAGLVVYPPVSLISNKGMDGSGTHGRGVFRRYSRTEKNVASASLHFPPAISDPHVQLLLRKAIWRQNGKFFGRFIDFIKFRAFHLGICRMK